jgi:hydrogenase maturation protease
VSDPVSNLVIGLGNPLRGDDGVGWWLARRARRCRPAPRVRLVPQLTPDLVLELAEARRVLFVDAWVRPSAWDGEKPCLRPVLAAQALGVFSHGLSSGELLAVAELLAPDGPPLEAWELLIPAGGFGIGEGFSSRLQRQLPLGMELLRQWCDARIGEGLV